MYSYLEVPLALLLYLDYQTWHGSWSSAFDDQPDQLPAEVWTVALPLRAAIMICGFCLVNLLL